MDQQQQQLIDRIKQAQNILVTVSANPSVDQLAAAIGLTLVLNKIGKHGTAVFSGQVPSTLEFLKPEETLEQNTDSLRDFIIALDKSKADKLRYKVEDDVVRIFITPYKTSISDKDLQFSQGDFNVDVVVCLGVTEQQDLDSAITAHGRILHDATVASVSTEGQGSLGSINWVDPKASSLSEMIVGLSDGLDKSVMDNQIATALLTGIVATTERFRNDKTTPKTMSASAELMASGANQSLIATELETPAEPQPAEPAAEQSDASDQAKTDEPSESKPEPGTLEIDHEAGEETDEPESTPEPEQHGPQIDVDENGQMSTVSDEAPTADEPKIEQPENHHQRITEPPKVDDGELTANAEPEELDPPTEELSLPTLGAAPLLSHDEPRLSPTPPAPLAPPTPDPAPASAPLQPAPTDWQPPVVPGETLSEIEQSVDSPHTQTPEAVEPSETPQPDTNGANVDDARSAVETALQNAGPGNDPLQPIEALNAQPLGPELQNEQANEQPADPGAAPAPFAPPSLPSVDPSQPPVPNTGFSEPTPGDSPADETLDMPLPTAPFGQPADPGAAPAPFAPPTPPPNLSAFPGAPAPNDGQNGGPTPPPVPPPMLPPLQ